MRSGKRGAVLVVALIFSVALGILTAGYLRLALSEYNRSQESLQFHGLINLAEAGAEEAVWALIHDDWTGWARPDSRYAWKRITGLSAGGGRTGTVTVMIDGYQEKEPVLIVESQVTARGQRTLSKQIRMELQHRSLFANGLTARDKLRFVGGNAAIDSYNSRRGAYHSSINRNDRGTAGSLLVEHDAVDLGNGSVWGYVATGGGDPSVGPNGSIRGADTPHGTRIDWRRVSRDFYAEFPLVETPTTSGIDSLPSGKTKSIGTVGTTTTYRIPSLSLGSQETLTINGDVILIVTGDSDIKGTLIVEEGATATIYTPGDFVVGGNGEVNNKNTPSSLVIYGTNPNIKRQNITLHGNGALSAAIYAPNAYLSLRGGGNSGVAYGAVVAFQVFVNGNYEFHYDEALDNFFGPRPTFRLRRWQELIGPDERVNLAKMADGVGIPTEDLSVALAVAP